MSPFPPDRPHPVRRPVDGSPRSRNRRTFLRALAAAGITLPSFPGASLAENGDGSGRHLVLIELQGGNDGLNTVVPYADPAYRRARPNIGLRRDEILPLDERLGLHGSLAPLMGMWNRGDLAIVEGVGYPQPNRSHFRSIEIWETASDADDIRLDGWLEPVLNALSGSSGDGVSAVAISQDEGPFAGALASSIVIDDIDRFVDRAARLPERDVRTSNPELAHVLAVERTARRAAIDFAERLVDADATNLPIDDIDGSVGEMEGGAMSMERESGTRPPRDLERQLDTVARLIAAEVGPRVWKVELGGFDTHVNQLRRHAALMTSLGEAIGGFERRLRAAGRWKDVMVMTYSEFGRRIGENANGGTDHGTAAPHFVAGGAVRGGLHGTPVDSGGLESGDLAHSTDFRSLYRTVSTDWFGQSLSKAPFSDYPRVPLVR